MIISATCEAGRLKQGNNNSKQQMRRWSRHWYPHTQWVAGLGPWQNWNPGQFSFFFPLCARKGTRLSWPEKAKLPQPFVASKAEYRLSLSGCVTQSTFVVYLQQWVKGTALVMFGDEEPGEGLSWEEALLSSWTFTFDFQLSWKHDSILLFSFSAWTWGNILSWDKSALLPYGRGR